MTDSATRARRPWMLAASFGLVSGLVLADEEEAVESFDRNPQNCVQLALVRSTDVLDDQTIIFYMRGRDKAYRNYLPRKCPGLERADRFSYVTRAGRLCDVDLITVLDIWAGRLEPGATCPLGAFYPLSPPEIEELRAQQKSGRFRNRDAVKVEPVELPPDQPVDEAAAPEPAESAERN